MAYLYICGTIVFSVIAQLILKWRIVQHGQLPIDLTDKVVFLVKALIDPFIFTGFIFFGLASLFWLAALTKFELSHAYPFMSLNFVIILLFSFWMLDEPISLQKILGVGFIIIGIVVIARS